MTTQEKEAKKGKKKHILKNDAQQSLRGLGVREREERGKGKIGGGERGGKAGEEEGKS